MIKTTYDPNSLRDRLRNKAIEARRPLSCTFELTYRCNFRCGMCYVRMTDAEAAPFGRMRTAEEWLDMGRQLCDAGVLYLTLTGGECTVYPEFPRLYEGLYRMGFRISLLSNAAAWTPEVRKLFAECPPYNVSISLYGGCAETYERVTGDPKGFEKVCSSIAFLKELGVPTDLSFTVTRENVLDYPKVAALCAGLGLPFQITTDLTPHARIPSLRNVEALRLSPAECVCLRSHPPAEIELAMEKAAELEGKLSSFTVPEAPEGPEWEDRTCVGAYTAAAIAWNGEMSTCISLLGADDIHPFEVGFEAAWQQLQEKRESRFRLPDRCAACAMRSDCAYHCAGRCYEGTRDPRTPDPVICKYVWLLREYRGTHPAADETSPRCK